MLAGMKDCKCCSRTLPLDAFYQHPNNADGRMGTCRGCILAKLQARKIARGWVPKQAPEPAPWEYPPLVKLGSGPLSIWMPQ